MTQAEAVLLVYLIVWTLVGHWYALRRWEMHRKHKRRSKAALKAAQTRKRTARAVPKGTPGKSEPKPRAKKKKPTLQDRVVTAESAWFTLLNGEEDAPDYNESDPLEQWRPQVRRFDGTAKEYAARDDSEGSV